MCRALLCAALLAAIAELASALRLGQDAARLQRSADFTAAVCTSSNVRQDAYSDKSCFSMQDRVWYGGGEEANQSWPLRGALSKPLLPMAVESRALPGPFWFSSKGDLFFVERGTPVFVEMNTTAPGQLCAVGTVMWPYRDRERVEYSAYTCQMRGPKEALLHAVNTLLHRPNALPDERMVRYPIWNTRVQYNRDVDEKAVRDFAEKITANGFANSQLEIDGRWETCFGSTEVDTQKFPAMKKLVSELHAQGLTVTLWSHAFVNQDCDTLSKVTTNGFLVVNPEGSYATKWWNGDAGVVDFTKASARNWWQAKHTSLMETYGIDGVSCDAGEVSWLPPSSQLDIPSDPAEDYPGAFTAEYARACADLGGMSSVKAGHYTQDLPVFVRMAEKRSRWGYDGGLKTLVPTLLQMNAAGYQFVLPEVIGGTKVNGDVISDELFIRWLQATTFMPAMRFSIAPWSFPNPKVTELTQKFVQLHETFAGAVLEAMNRSMADGTPVNPPVWWISPEDEVTHSLDSEFLLGEHILVAPVVEKGATARDVYLPRGFWKDGNTGVEHKGPTWLRGYAAPLNTLPYFLRGGYQPPPLSTASTSSPPCLSGFLLLVAVALLVR